MFERIVIALDLREDPQKITRIIKDFRDESKRKIFLIHVVDIDSAGLMAGTLKSDDDVDLQNIAHQISKKGVKVEKRVTVGVPAQRIRSYADEVGAELIVVGAHNKGLTSKVLLGSISSDVIRKSKIPVLVLKDIAFAEGGV